MLCDIITHNENIDLFIEDLQETLDKYLITFRVSLDKYVLKGKLKSNGYFDNDCRILACSFGVSQSKWLKTLVHESCHLDQWRENCIEWQSLESGNTDSCTLFFDWLDDKRINRGFNWAKKHAGIIRDLELDCEKRTVAKILKYGLPINRITYTKEACAYILFYNFIAETRQWYKIGKEPYNNKKILALMPGSFYDLNKNYLTDELRKLYWECVK